MNNSEYDIAVIGGGIIGLATAMRLSQEFPRYRVAVLEKEREVALHQTGHNSGVIHAGIYYAPGSQKANFCLHRRLPAAAVLRRARHRVRDVRQAHRGHRRRRGAAPGGALPPRHRERRPGAADGRPGAPARDRAPRRGSPGRLLAQHGHHRLHQGRPSLRHRDARERRRPAHQHPGAGHRRPGRHPLPADAPGRDSGQAADQLRRASRRQRSPHDGRGRGRAYHPVQGRVLLHSPPSAPTL